MESPAASERTLTVAGLSLLLGRFSGLVPPLSPSARSELREDIAIRGVLVPLLVDEHGVVLDGQNRAEIADELRLARLPVEVISGKSEEEKREIAVKVNTCRRQLSREERAEVVRCLVEAGLSQRAAAKQVGIDKRTVGKDLKRSGGDGSPPEPPTQDLPQGKRKGVDSKSYPASPAPPASRAQRATQAKALKGQGKSTRQIADAQGVSVGTVASDLSAAAQPRRCERSHAWAHRFHALAAALLPPRTCALELLDEADFEHHPERQKIERALVAIREASKLALEAREAEFTFTKKKELTS